MRKGEYIDFATGQHNFTIPNSGLYKIEIWGSQGEDGNSYGSCRGGFGGYVSGEIKFKKGQSLFIFCGSVVNNGGTAGFWHHGREEAEWGYADGGGGGGATHVATVNRGAINNYAQHLDELLMVAGGGGGSYSSTSAQDRQWATNGGAGGTPISEGEAFSPQGASGNVGWKDESFVIRGSGAGGGGYVGGGSGGGGKSYAKDILLNTVITANVRNGTGIARITLLKKGNTTYGDKEMEIYFGDVEISKSYGDKDM